MIRTTTHGKSRLNSAIALSVLLALSACSSSDDDDGGITDGITDDTAIDGVDDVDGIDDVSDAAGPGACPVVGNLIPVELAANQCQISGQLTENAVLTADQSWFLEGSLQIGTAEIAATLDIDPGTQIFGDNTDVTDYVLVYPGSSLRANGTGANPVQFLSDDDNVDGRGEWGGVFLRGFNGLPTLAGTQGSNLLDYTVIAEAGAAVEVTIDNQSTTYTDNLVLNGVDSNTVLSFVQSHNSARDGLHILSGDPRMAWILVTGAARDGVWYRDFSGLIKDLISNPRIVNATLVGRDSTSEVAGDNDNEFGILFADNTDQIRMGNVLIANFRNGCFEADTAADLSQIDTATPGPNYLDGVHCASEAGANGNFGIVRDNSTGFPVGTIASNNSNGDGLVYYNGAGSVLGIANTPFDSASGGFNFTGELVDRTANFTAGWYLDNLRGVGNGLVADSTFLNGFLDGDTNQDGVVDAADTNSPFIIGDDGEGGFNQDVAADTFGYDLTHVGAVRGGAVTNTQFDGWTVDTGPDDSFTVQVNPANL